MRKNVQNGNICKMETFKALHSSTNYPRFLFQDKTKAVSLKPFSLLKVANVLFVPV